MYGVRKIGELIKRAPVTVSPTTSIRNAVQIMNRENIGSVIVTDPEGRVLGIFTERDLVRVIAEGVDLDSNIASVMTRNPVVIYEDEPISRAVILMAEKRIRHLPVINRKGLVVGMVTARDITETFRRYLEELGDIGE
ncbi:MAG: CBS domain-containing protein [Sulfolobales archaeon]